MSVLTPEQFVQKVNEIMVEHMGDPVELHGQTDFLMEETLTALGYKEGIDLITDLPRWYE